MPAGMQKQERPAGILQLPSGQAMLQGAPPLPFKPLDLLLASRTHPNLPPVPPNRASERVQKLTYAETMHCIWGRAAGVLVRASVILACGGFLVLYLIILYDVVCGEWRQGCMEYFDC